MKKKLFTVLLSTLLVGSSFVNALSVSAASSKRLGNVLQYRQEKDYWCGYAAMQSEINNAYKSGSITSQYDFEWRQSGVANYMEKNYNMHPYVNNINVDGSLAWYTGNKNVDSNQANYPVVQALRKITGFYYVSYGCCTTGSSNLESSEVKSKLVSTINLGHAVLACGRSNSQGTSYMPGYPSGKVVHWIASDGYMDGGDKVWIVDPAGDNVSVLDSNWSNVSRYYFVSIDKFTDFAWYHGIIW